MEKDSDSIKQKIFSGLFWKFGERITAQLISLFISILLARLLTPSDYGAVALVMVFITLANVFVSNGFGNALIQKQDADNVDFSSVFYINLIISFIIYALLYLTAPYVATFYSLPVMCPALRVLGIRIPVAAVNSVQQAYVSRYMLFKRFFWSTLFGTLLSGIVGVFLAYHGFGVWALIVQYLTNTCIDTIVLWFTVRWRPNFVCSWKRARGLISYGWKLLFSSLLDTGYNQIRSLIIGKIYTSSDLAFYNQGDKYPSLVVTNINASISGVLFPALAQCQSQEKKVKQMTRRAIEISSYIMWPLMIGLAVIAEPVIRMILTDKWLSCVPYLRIFCFTYGLWPIHTSNLQAIKALGRSDLFLKLEVMKKTIGIIALLISINYGPLAIAWSLVITGIISTFINATPNVKLLHYSYKEQMEDLLPSLVIAFAMGVIIYPITWLRFNDIITVLIQVVCGGIIYFMGSIISKQSAFLYLIDFIKKRRTV